MNLQVPTRERPLILLVDDEDDILDLLQYNLQKEEYDTLLARDGAEGLELAVKHVPDIIVLDIMMPRMDGLEACRRMREHSTLLTVPILILTARSEAADQVVGLDSGADIYLAKPISIPVLLSQVKALLRGSSRYDTPPDLLRIMDLEIDRDRYVVRRTGTDVSIRLARKEFDLLYFFASRPGKVFSRQDLLDRVWGRDVYVVDRTVDVHVRKIREKIGDHYIETIKGVGYRFADTLPPR
jgi:two-component system alkaline phosphatase synthesis response regulator PhoP